MKKIVKNYLLNIIFIIISIAILVFSFFNDSEIIFYLFLITFTLSFIFNQKDYKKKEYHLFTKYKSIFIITILVIEVALVILAKLANGFTGYGYLALMAVFALAIGFALLIDLLVRLVYKLIKNQKFNYKSIYKDNLIAKIIIILLIAILFIIPMI